MTHCGLNEYTVLCAGRIEALAEHIVFFAEVFGLFLRRCSLGGEIHYHHCVGGCTRALLFDYISTDLVDIIGIEGHY